MAMRQRLAWHHFTFRIPDDWELTGYGINPERGGLNFSNRHGFQGVVRWARHSRPPDLKRDMLSYLQTRILGGKAGRIRDTSAFESKDIHGFSTLRHTTLELPAQAMRYLPDEQVTVHWSFPDGSSSAVRNRWTPLLGSFAPNHQEPREYALLGIHCRLPADCRVTGIQARPANVAITFKDQQRELAFRRWGLLDITTGGHPPELFYRQWLEADGCICESVTTRQTTIGQAVTITFHERDGEATAKRFRPTRRKPARQGSGTLWHHTAEHRLYAFEQRFPDGQSPHTDIGAICPALGAAEGN